MLYCQQVLPRGATISLERSAGTRVRVLSGCIWLTQERDLRDYYLRSGDELKLSGYGLALIGAVRDSAVEVVAPESPGRMRRRALAFLALLGLAAPDTAGAIPECDRDVARLCAEAGERTPYCLIQGKDRVSASCLAALRNRLGDRCSPTGWPVHFADVN